MKSDSEHAHTPDAHTDSLMPVAVPLPSRRVKLIGLGFALLASAVSVVASAHFQRPTPPERQANNDVKVAGTSISIADGAPQWKLVKLGVAKPSGEQWTDPVAASIKVDEARAARVAAPLTGRVVKVFVELGEHVTSGQALFSVASPSLAELSEEEIRARVELDAARAARDRVAALVEARAVPAKESLTAERELKTAEVAHTVATSKLSALKVVSRSDNEFLVKAPMDGSVVEKNVLPGQQVGEGNEANLMMIADLSKVWAVANLFESNAAGVERGTHATVNLASDPSLQLEGVVDMVSGVVDPERHTVPVRIVLDNREGRLKPNTFARMRFLSSALPGSVDVAATSLVTDGEVQSVYVRDNDGKFTRRTVVAGAVREGRVTILSGLKAGETVVESGAVLLDNQVSLAE